MGGGLFYKGGYKWVAKYTSACPSKADDFLVVIN